jgi:hypothetical protein
MPSPVLVAVALVASDDTSSGGYETPTKTYAYSAGAVARPPKVVSCSPVT